MKLHLDSYLVQWNVLIGKCIWCHCTIYHPDNLLQIRFL